MSENSFNSRNKENRFSVPMINPMDSESKEKIESFDIYSQFEKDKDSLGRYDYHFETFNLIEKFASKYDLPVYDYFKLIINVLEKECLYQNNDNAIARNVIAVSNYATYIDLMLTADRDISSMNKSFLETAEKEKLEGKSIIGLVLGNEPENNFVKTENKDAVSDNKNSEDVKFEEHSNSPNNGPLNNGLDQDQDVQENFDTEHYQQYEQAEYESDYWQYQNQFNQEQDISPEENIVHQANSSPIPEKNPENKKYEPNDFNETVPGSGFNNDKSNEENSDFSYAETKSSQNPLEELKKVQSNEMSLKSKMESEQYTHDGKPSSLFDMKNTITKFAARKSAGNEQSFDAFYEVSIHKIANRLRESDRANVADDFLLFCGAKTKSYEDAKKMSKPDSAMRCE